MTMTPNSGRLLGAEGVPLPKLPDLPILNATRLKFGVKLPGFGDGPNTVSDSTVSNTELSEFFALTRRAQ